MEKKFPEPDPEFYMKVRKAAMNDYQRGIVFILQSTGMHLQCLVSLTPAQMNLRGDILWRRTKTARPMRARIPKMDRREVRDWIRNYGSNNRTGRWVQYNLKEVGLRAGFPDLSPMTFRTQRAVRLLDDGEPYHEVAHLMGCSPSVLMANYAQLKDDRKVDGIKPWTGHLNRHGPEFDDSPCGSCGRNITGDIMDTDVCDDAGCHGDFEAWTPARGA